MSNKYKFGDNDKLYFVTLTVVQWIDLFIRLEYKSIIYESLEYCQKKKGLELYAYCIMPSHIHMIIGSSKNKLPDIMRDLKKHTSRELKSCIESNQKESRREWLLSLMREVGANNSNNVGFQLWKQDSHPVVLDNEKIMEHKLAYIHDNPLVARFVDDPSAWVDSSCSFYARGSSPRVSLLNLYGD